MKIEQTQTQEPDEKKHKVTAAERAVEMMARAAGDVLLHSKLPTLAKSSIAAKMAEMAQEFARLADQAFGTGGAA